MGLSLVAAAVDEWFGGHPPLNTATATLFTLHEAPKLLKAGALTKLD
jgi:hypothetical protein